MQDIVNTRHFLEDDFDLDDFRARAVTRTRNKLENKRTHLIIRLMTALIVIIAFVVAYYLYNFLDNLIEWIRTVNIHNAQSLLGLFWYAFHL